ncbi:MAG: HAMP domain-containing sensor histidine kinase [Candidatus Methanoperedens sp.]|nr:HAMP domain-containing sensor histidine kinase [Candidatus Methanoperedens sp.]
MKNQSNNLVKKFSIYSILIILLLGLVLNFVIAQKIEEMVIERTKATTVSMVEVTAQTNDFHELIKTNFSQDNSKSFHHLYASLKTDEIIRIKMFNTMGTIIYSDEDELIGKTFNDNDELNEALEGSIEVEINRELDKEENVYERQDYSGLMEIYVPIKNDLGEIDGVIELYQILDNTDNAITDLQFTVAIIIFLGLSILYFALIWIVRDAAVIIVNQNAALSKAYEDLKSIDILKNHFINTMSHELRTPLNSIIGFSDILRQKTAGELNQIQEKYLDNILSSSQHLLGLINEILDVIILDAGKMELNINKIPVNDTIDEIIERSKQKPNKNRIQIIKEIDPQLQYIDTEKDKFSLILLQLLNNSIKFSKPDGFVKIIAKKIGNMAQFSISDNGIGIKKENMGKLFQVFNQIDSGTSREYGGTGLGLSISKKLVELHGGKIWAESNFGEGSTFTFQIPIENKKGVVKV